MEKLGNLEGSFRCNRYIKVLFLNFILNVKFDFRKAEIKLAEDSTLTIGKRSWCLRSNIQ